jgi:peroxiredoxin
MNYLNLALLATSFTFVANAQKTSPKKTFTLKGKVIGQDSGYVYLNYLNSSEKYINDSCYLKKGLFEFQGAIVEPTKASFTGKTVSRSVEDPNRTDIYLEPAIQNATLSVNDFKHVKITGSKTQREHAIYTNRLDSLNGKWKNILDARGVAIENNDTAKLALLEEADMPNFQRESNNLSYQFIKDYPSSVVSADILVYKTRYLTLDSVRMFYNLFPATVRLCRDGKFIANYIKGEENIAVGKPAPSFSQEDMNGKLISSADFKGKYVILDFWASWCGPCREEHPYLKQAYTKYHDKGLEIIGISLDWLEYKKAWLDAIKEDGLPWIQLCDFKYMDNEILKQYNLVGKGVPANFLIGPDGTILAMNLRGDDVEKELAKLIQ